MPESPEALSQHDLLTFTGGSHRQGWKLTRQEQEVFVPVSARLRVNNSFAVRDAAAQGLGVALLPLAVANSLPATHQLTRVLPEWGSAPIPVHAVFPGLRYLTPKVRAFIDLAVEMFSDS